MREELLAAAEALLKKHGPGKVTVSEIAAVCGMSQPNAYRFFPSKKALMGEIAARWFASVEHDLGELAASDMAPDDAIRAWVLIQLRHKRAAFDRDPDLFRAYLSLAADNMDVVAAHVAVIHETLERIVARRLRAIRGRAIRAQVRRDAGLIYDMTLQYRDPTLIARARDICTDTRANSAVDILLRGLSPA